MGGSLRKRSETEAWRALQRRPQQELATIHARHRKERATIKKTSIDRKDLDRLLVAVDLRHRKELRDHRDNKQNTNRATAAELRANGTLTIESVAPWSFLDGARLDDICRVLESQDDLTDILKLARVIEILQHVRMCGSDKQKLQLARAVFRLRGRGRQPNRYDAALLARAKRKKSALQSAIVRVNRRFRSRLGTDQHRRAIDQDVLLAHVGWAADKRRQFIGPLLKLEPVDAASKLVGEMYGIPSHVVRRLGRVRTVNRKKPT